MNIEFYTGLIEHRNGDNATHSLAHLAARLALSLLLAGGGHASSTLLTNQPARRTNGRVQLRSLG